MGNILNCRGRHANPQYPDRGEVFEAFASYHTKLDLRHSTLEQEPVIGIILTVNSSVQSPLLPITSTMDAQNPTILIYTFSLLRMNCNLSKIAKVGAA